ncbi:MAG TPA: tetratricopeptide repeat protein, partial [Chitinophagaceae bacterium]|nr:tetratricopeptide repeat protein [Chitinophagaceae bacterium]
LLLGTGVKAQNIQEGINHLYADRFQHAEKVFNDLLAANPNNIEATYWLGQTYFDMDVNDKARDLYAKALTTTNNAPLILVGAAHADLTQKKVADARQKFETAITMTRGRKGDDPVILNAIGRAIVDAQKDTTMLAYAVEKLKTAAERDDKSADIQINLGNAIRKARPGEGGGEAYTAYQKAISLNPNFPIAYFRLAKLFEGQKNWELVVENLEKAIAIDPKFAAAHYELFFYYLLSNNQKLDKAEASLQKLIDSKTPYTDPADQYLYGQLCWVKKDFRCAVDKGESVMKALGQAAKPKVHLLLADAYYNLPDSVNAKKYIESYFTREKPEDLVLAYPFSLQGKILLKFPGNEQKAYESVLEGVKRDTIIDNKLKELREMALEFRKIGRRDLEAQLFSQAIALSPKPVIQDYDGAVRGYYFSKKYSESLEVSKKLRDNWNGEIYGYEWVFNNSRVLDTVKRDSIAVPAAIALYDFIHSKDTIKFKRQLVSATGYLADYYANYAHDNAKAVQYMYKLIWTDSTNKTQLQRSIDALQNRQSAPRGNATPTQTQGSKPAGTKPSPAVKPNSPATKPKAVAPKK